MPEKFTEVTLILIGSTVIILILITLIVVALFINQKRKFRHRQQLDNMKNEFDNEILKTQLEIQTQTFETVSKELHDNVSNTISLALLNLNLGGSKPDEDKIQGAKSLMLEAKNAVKDFSWSISPVNLAAIGFTRSLNELVDRFKKINTIKFETTITGEEFSVEPECHIIIYRIVQEALSNCVKHSRCDTVRISVDFNKPELSLCIADNGCGFDTGQVMAAKEKLKSSGLSNIFSRAVMIGAEIKVESAPGNGSMISLTCKEEKSTAGVLP
jgi:two-component system, NarL family, sensor kinase